MREKIILKIWGFILAQTQPTQEFCGWKKKPTIAPLQKRRPLTKGRKEGRKLYKMNSSRELAMFPCVETSQHHLGRTKITASLLSPGVLRGAPTAADTASQNSTGRENTPLLHVADRV